MDITVIFSADRVTSLHPTQLDQENGTERKQRQKRVTGLDENRWFQARATVLMPTRKTSGGGTIQKHSAAYKRIVAITIRTGYFVRLSVTIACRGTIVGSAGPFQQQFQLGVPWESSCWSLDCDEYNYTAMRKYIISIPAFSQTVRERC